LRIRQLLRSTEFAGVLLFALATGLPPFDDATEVDLTLHMLQHVVIIIAGVLIAYPHYGRRLLRKGGKGLIPGVSLVASAALIVYWHLPGPWDGAVLNPAVHLAEHLSFLVVGLLAGSWLLLLSDSGKIGGLMAAFFGHMGYAVVLISPWNSQVYSLYSLSDQVTAGWVLLLTGPVLVVGVAYVIARNPDWLAGLAGQVAKPGARRETIINRARVPKWAATALTVIFVATLVGYFAATAYALGTAGPAPPGGSTVYISETPISWQYSPQNITVVVGVNSTVTWVSRSIAYDTVTARDGSFASGTIPPGGTFSFTFRTPGTYQYYCLYHPWMTGTVTVLAGA
jgi:plastocyanin/cytochrome c oxidase assembly factor CtaG